MQDRKLHKITSPRRTNKSRRSRFYFNRHLFFSFQFLKLKRTLIFLFTLCSLLLLSNYIRIPFLTPFQEKIGSQLAPLVERIKRPIFSTVHFFQSWHRFWAHKDEIASLKTENTQLKIALGSAQQNTAQMHIQNTLLRHAPRLPKVGALKVIGYPGAPFVQNALAVFLNSPDYPEKSPILHPGGLVGFLNKPGTQYAYITLITNVNAKVPAITGITKQHGIVVGHGSHPPSLDYIDMPKVKEGEPVYTSGGGGIFPSNILIGHLNLHDGHPYIVPTAPLNDLNYLYIVPPMRDLKEDGVLPQKPSTS